MPLHRIYVPNKLYSDQEKQEFSQSITQWYASRGMPAFYVVVLFIEVPSSSFFVGGLTHEERSKDFKPFVRWTIERLARHQDSKEARNKLMSTLEGVGAKWLKDRDYDCEITVNEPSQELWKISGEFPPIVGDADMKAWIEANGPVQRTS